MPSADFFRNLGLFVWEEFFDPAFCARLRSEMSSASGEQAGIDEDSRIDETVRKVLRMEPEEAAKLLVMERLLALKPKLEDHFQVSLADCEEPQYLMYNQGSFYLWHTDSGTRLGVRERQVSIVIFLNSAAKEPAPDCYGGGSLTFLGILDGPLWENCPLPLEAETGLLVAFRSNLKHEVRPVTFGRRFTIATWYGGVESSSN
jgi:SM-20-related protein